MRRSRIRGGSLAVVAAFLFAVVGEHAGMHGCPLHDAVGEAGNDATAASHGAHHRAPLPDDERPHPTPCTCVGMCHGSASAPVPAGGAAGLPAPATGIFRTALAPGQPLLRSPTPWLVPWPNGPPLS